MGIFTKSPLEARLKPRNHMFINQLLRILSAMRKLLRGQSALRRLFVWFLSNAELETASTVVQFLHEAQIDSVNLFDLLVCRWVAALLGNSATGRDTASRQSSPTRFKPRDAVSPCLMNAAQWVLRQVSSQCASRPRWSPLSGAGGYNEHLQRRV